MLHLNYSFLGVRLRQEGVHGMRASVGGCFEIAVGGCGWSLREYLWRRYGRKAMVKGIVPQRSRGKCPKIIPWGGLAPPPWCSPQTCSEAEHQRLCRLYLFRGSSVRAKFAGSSYKASTTSPSPTTAQRGVGTEGKVRSTVRTSF